MTVPISHNFTVFKHLILQCVVIDKEKVLGGAFSGHCKTSRWFADSSKLQTQLHLQVECHAVMHTHVLHSYP